MKCKAASGFVTWPSIRGRCHADHRPTLDARLPGPDAAGVVATRRLLRPRADTAAVAKEPGGEKDLRGTGQVGAAALALGRPQPPRNLGPQAQRSLPGPRRVSIDRDGH